MTDPERTRPTDILLLLTETDGVVTGTFRCVDYYMDAADVTGTLSGAHLEIESTILGPVTFEGDVRDQTITGTCTYSGATDVWEVTRVD